MSCVQLPEGGFRVVYPLGLQTRLSGVVKVVFGYGWYIAYPYIYVYIECMRMVGMLSCC